MKVKVELPELPEGYEYTGKMFPELGDEYIDGGVGKNGFPDVYRWGSIESPVLLHPVVRKKQLTYKDLRMGEWFRFTDEEQPYQKLFDTSLARPVVRIKVSFEDVK